MAFDPEQGNDPVIEQKKAALKAKLVEAFRKTGHVAEEGLGAVAEAALEVTLVLGQSER